MSKITLNQVERVRVFEHAVEQIRSAIEQGELKPGDKLPTEQELCNKLGVGRSSIREAIRVLEAEGYIEVRRGSGTFIIQSRTSQPEQLNSIVAWLEKRKESLTQILQIRERIEGLTVYLAAATADDQLIARLATLLDEQSALVEKGDDIDHFSELDCQFHLTISEASGNDIAHEIMQHIIPAFNEGNKAVIFAGKRTQKILQEHEEILSALKEGDPEKAERSMRTHIGHVQGIIAKMQDDSVSDPST